MAHVLLVLTVLVYAGSLNNGFAFKDESVIIENRWLRSVRNIPTFFRPAFWGEEMDGVMSGYRPITLASYAVDFSVWRKDALGYHLTNLGIHLMAVLAFFFLARRFVGDDGLAFIGGLLFAFHPLSTEAVCYLAVRATLLAWAFTLLAWLAWWRSWDDASGREHKKHLWGWYAVALVLSILGLGSSPATAALPLLMLATAASQKEDFHQRRSVWIGILPFVFLSAVVLVLNWNGAIARAPFITQGGSHGLGLSSLGETTVKALSLVFFPVHLVAGRSLSVPAAYSWLGFVLLLILGLLCLFGRRRFPKTCFGLMIAGATLTPPLLASLFTGDLRGEHQLYGLSGGFILVVLCSTYEAASVGVSNPSLAKRQRLITLALLVTTGLVFATLTANRHMAWENSWTISQDTLKSQPDNVPLKAHVGRLSIERGELDKAEQVLNKLSTLAPDSPYTRALAGEIALSKGDAEAALSEFKRAADLRPGDSSFATLELEALFALGRMDEADRLATELLRSHPEEPSVHFLKARIEERRGGFQSALSYYRETVELAPSRPGYHLARGEAAKKLGLMAEAEGAFRTAIREGPGLLDAYGALAKLLLTQERPKEAIFLLASVVRWHPERPDLGMILAEAWSKQGHPERAEELYRVMLSRNPEGAEATAIQEALSRLEKTEAQSQNRPKKTDVSTGKVKSNN